MAKGFLSGLFSRKKDNEETQDPAGDSPGLDEPSVVDDAPAEEARAKDTIADETGETDTPSLPETKGPTDDPVPPPPSPQVEEPVLDAHTDTLAEKRADEQPADEQPAEVHPTDAADEPPKKTGFFSRLKQGLSKTSGRLTEGVTAIFTKKKLDDDMLEELESLLISADLGLPAATRLTTALAKEKFDKEVTDEDVRRALADDVAETLRPLARPLTVDAANRPHVIVMTGVNGAGKTTTIGKLAAKFKAEGQSVMLAAGDTFRAAAIEQLTVWGERTDTPVIAKTVGADAAGLAYDAVEAARAQNIDVLMIDTAGRLQNKRELMDELAKVVRVIRKLDDTAPHDTVLVLDATVGQNALSQVDVFKETAGVTGLVMTKLDGTARGGVLVALADKFSLPVHFVGVGESVDDLQAFDADNFARALADIA
ncbi:MAG: signal recognition particle-docking protein FtsY [Pseudomonadota bacterium]